MSPLKTALRLPAAFAAGSGRLFGAALLLGATAIGTAQAQQAYYRGEAEQGDSVIVNLSVIDKLTGGAPAAPALPSFAAPSYGSATPSAAPMMPAPALVAPKPSSATALAEPPSSMPESTLLVPGTSTASAPKASGIPLPPQPSAAPKPSAPPPKPSVTAEPTPADAPMPAPMPKPAPEAAPESKIEAPAPKPAAKPAEEAPTETAALTPEPAPEPAPMPEPAPEPAPEPIAAPEPPAPTPTGEAAVAAIDLSAVDKTGIAKNADGISILFATESQDLPGGASTALDEIASTMKSQPDSTLKLLGYSEAIGDSPSKPRRLSLFRALAVRTYLLKQGIDSRRMTVQALGSKDPETDRPKNRVDLVLSSS